jgi:hypothetical protein
MGRKYYLTNTAQAIGGTHASLATNEFALSDTPGSGSDSENVAAGAYEVTHGWEFPSGMGETDWSGNWGYSYDASSTDAAMQHGIKQLSTADGHVCRLNSSEAEQEASDFVTTHTGAGTFSESGVDLGLSASANSTDILAVFLAGNGGHAHGTAAVVVNFGSSSYIDTPWPLSITGAFISSGSSVNAPAYVTLLEEESTSDLVSTNAPTSTLNDGWIDIDGTSITPGAGDYLVFFSAIMECPDETTDDSFSIELRAGSTTLAGTTRVHKTDLTIVPTRWQINAVGYASSVGAADAIRARWNKATGARLWCFRRTLMLIKVNSSDIQTET